MQRTLRFALALGASFGASLGGSLHAQIEPDAVLLRYPDVSATEICFLYDGDLWLVPKEGGDARRLTTVDGNEGLPKFSPDGSKVAFLAGYDGGNDVYVMDVVAGAPQRVTYHPGREMLCDWTPDGEALLYWSSERSGIGRAPRIFRVGVDGGQPEPLPVPYGTFGSLDDSGEWLAYTPGSREFRTWKRYRGGLASDIWLFHVTSHESRHFTDYEGSDAQPMWNGSEVVFLSDRGANGRMNLYAKDVASGTVRQLTSFADADVKFPSIGPEDLVFEAGGKLWRYAFADGSLNQVRVRIPGERRELRARTIDAAAFQNGASAGPGGVRLAVEARGDVFSVPVEDGVTRNLTHTNGVAEREPAWSPDGKWVAYFSDRSGEYELTVRRADGKTFEGADDHGERKLSAVGPGWKSNLEWSPDAEWLSFATNDGTLHLVRFEDGEHRRVHQNPAGNPFDVDWSHDSSWLAWSHRHAQAEVDGIYLYDVEAAEVHSVTSGMFDDSNPAFDREGNWLFFTSTRTFQPIYEDLGDTWIYANTRNLLAVPLRADVENPWAVENDEEEIEEEEEDAEEGEDEDADSEDDADADAEAAAGEDAEEGDESEGEDEDSDEEDDERLEIELEGFESRAMMLPVEGGSIGNLEGAAGKVLFVRTPRTGADGGEVSLHYYDMKEKEAKKVLGSGFGGGYVPTAKGDKIMVWANGGMGIVSLAPGQEFEAVDLSGMTMTVDPREEWPQLLADVHRLYRDFFYEPTLHGVDWDGVHARYRDALKDATSRSDVHWMIGEMIAELNVGHAYNSPPRGGFENAGRARPVGLLGCDWSIENGAYRIARILGDSGPYDADARSPLAKLGVDVEAGDYLLAVNGVPVDPQRSIYEAFQGTAGRATELTVNANPTLDGEERHVLVEPLSNERSLRYRDAVSRKRAEVLAKSDGRVGYIHVPSTGFDGQNELYRQFLGQRHLDALLIDERWNSGGQIPTRFIELLNRPVTNYWAIRHGEDWEWPPVAHNGPKAMLINGWAGSGGDAFPYYFRQSGLGKLIGRRTWGGLVGISGNPGLIDGASPTVPRFAFYELDGTWGVEGHGVDPDIEVMDDPALMVDGGDPQLDVAVRHLLEELERRPPTRPSRPASPNRSGSGIPAADQ